MPSARAVFAFNGESADELCFAVGDVIDNVEVLDEEWSEGDFQGARGLFPSSFVAMLPSAPPPSAPRPKPKPKPVPTPKPKPSGPPPEGLAVGLMDFDAADPDELSFKANDQIRLLRRIDSTWYEGECGGRFGRFSKGFILILKELPDDSAPPTPTETAPAPAPKPLAKPKPTPAGAPAPPPLSGATPAPAPAAARATSTWNAQPAAVSSWNGTPAPAGAAAAAPAAAVDDWDMSSTPTAWGEVSTVQHSHPSTPTPGKPPTVAAAAPPPSSYVPPPAQAPPTPAAAQSAVLAQAPAGSIGGPPVPGNAGDLVRLQTALDDPHWFNAEFIGQGGVILQVRVYMEQVPPTGRMGGPAGGAVNPAMVAASQRRSNMIEKQKKKVLSSTSTWSPVATVAGAPAPVLESSRVMRTPENAAAAASTAAASATGGSSVGASGGGEDGEEHKKRRGLKAMRAKLSRKKHGNESMNASSANSAATAAAATDPLVGRVATAVHDFEGEDASELTLYVGASVTIIDRVNEDWLKGALDGRTGMFPQVFVDF